MNRVPPASVGEKLFLRAPNEDVQPCHTRKSAQPGVATIVRRSTVIAAACCAASQQPASLSAPGWRGQRSLEQLQVGRVVDRATALPPAADLRGGQGDRRCRWLARQCQSSLCGNPAPESDQTAGSILKDMPTRVPLEKKKHLKSCPCRCTTSVVCRCHEEPPR